ncbi:hypothetical protein niasHT_024546 [Heterodera trifolii]|uniref:18S rRNA (pseudouridine-N1)-methyltransferase n=1 Tax=Heterodera trifolii TaxID=157864 RepID=A0ABD2K7B4_9BILA
MKPNKRPMKHPSAPFSRDAPRSKRLKQSTDGAGGKRLFVVIEDCSLEVAKVGAEHVVLCSDKHANWLRKQNRDPAQFRPDILHQCLLMLQDSPLNSAGLLRVFFRTKQNVLVSVSPQCRLPRTFDRFCGLMVQLLHKLQIRAADSSQKLLNVVKNPVTTHLPVGCRKFLSTLNCPNLVSNMAEKVQPEADEPVVIVVGGIAHGKISTDYTEEDIKISNYPLSAALCCAKLTSAFEQLWGVL